MTIVDAVATLAALAAELRRHGLSTDPSQTGAAAQSLAALGEPEITTLYWVARASYCGSPDDLRVFDEVFTVWRHGRGVIIPESLGTAPPESRPDEPTDSQRTVSGDSPDSSGGSRIEVLGRRPIAGLTPAERAEINLLIALLRPLAERPSRRRRAQGADDVDSERTVAAMLSNGGELAEIVRDRRRTRPRRLVILLDVSESMAGYTEALLRFAHAAVQAAPRTTEVFALGSRLTRLTPALRVRYPDRAVAGVSAMVEDWHGGTRLGATVAEFTGGWGRRGVARGATVVICSDGETDTGDDELLAEHVRRLKRLAQCIVWADPYLGQPGYLPVGAGLLAARANLDVVMPAGSYLAMAELARHLTGG